MELVERYIYAVTKRLPQTQREDIEKELRSLIEDMLSERCGENPPQKQDVERVLTELGNPSELAAKYRGVGNYLIGPEYYDIYIMVLKIVMAAVVFATGLGKAIELTGNPPVNAAEGIAELLTAMITGLFQGFTWVTVIFAVNERYIRKNIICGDWKVSDLPEIPKKDEIIKPAGPVVGIVFAAVFFVIFYFASDLLSVYHLDGGRLSFVPLFSAQGLKSFLPLLFAFYLLSVLKECLKLIIGRRNLALGIATAAINTVLLVLCALVFTNPGVWNANFVNELGAAGIAPSDMPISLDSIWNGVTRGFIWVIAFGFTVESLEAVIKGIRYGR